jgi:hypothetical protein
MPCPWIGLAGSGRGTITQGVVLVKKWTVLIRGIGVRVVEAKDIDGAYAAAMDIFSCKLDDILAVFSHTPINVKESK